VLQLRKDHPAITDGDQRVLDSPPNILAIERSGGGERLVIIANLSARPATYRVSGRDLLAGSDVRTQLRLRPYQATVVALAGH
jgi:glycosidase